MGAPYVNGLHDLQYLDAMTGALFQWRARSFWFGDYSNGDSFYKRLISSMITGLEDGWMCILLLLCPNITELDMNLPSDFKKTFSPVLMLCLARLSRPVPDPVGQVANVPPQSHYVASQMFGS